MQGPLTRARAQQFNNQVSSFLSSSTYTCEDGMLPNAMVNYIILRNFGEEQECFGNQHGPGEDQGGRPSKERVQVKMEAQFDSESASAFRNSAR